VGINNRVMAQVVKGLASGERVILGASSLAKAENPWPRS
jgi:hypothetical protein